MTKTKLSYLKLAIPLSTILLFSCSADLLKLATDLQAQNTRPKPLSSITASASATAVETKVSPVPTNLSSGTPAVNIAKVPTMANPSPDRPVPGPLLPNPPKNMPQNPLPLPGEIGYPSPPISSTCSSNSTVRPPQYPLVPPSATAPVTLTPPPSVTPTPSVSANVPVVDSAAIPDIYKKVYGATEIYREGDYIVIKSDGRPQHKSPYYKGTQWEGQLYEAYNGSKVFRPNPSKIAEYNLGIKIPVNPKEDPSHSKTPMGPMGIAVNGVAFFNQYARGGSPLGDEIVSFDQYNGHPAQTDNYHYHEEPAAITAVLGKNALLGFLLDGFPVYGPEEDGKTITNADLDQYHGHFHKTVDFPEGIYHYHTTEEAPYINGNGFYGKAGIVLR